MDEPAAAARQASSGSSRSNCTMACRRSRLCITACQRRGIRGMSRNRCKDCLLYTSDAADDM
eukprot:2965654-Alexandrium_andersonii.AAC.1